MSEKGEGMGASSERVFERRELTKAQMWYYSLSYFGLMAMINLMSTFTVTFYVSIMGLPPFFVGLVYGSSLYLYAFTGPLWGTFCDKFKTRFGRKKSSLLVTFPILCVMYVLLWMPPTTNTTYGGFEMGLGVYYIITMYLFRIFESWFQSAYLSMLPDISTVEENRVKTTSINVLFLTLGSAVGLAAPIIFLGEATDIGEGSVEFFYHASTVGKEIYSQVMLFGLLATSIFIVGVVLLFVFIKEPEVVSCADDKLSFKSIIEPLRDRNQLKYLIVYFIMYLPATCLIYLIFSFALNIIQLQGNEFYIFGGVALVMCVMSFVIWEKLIAKFGLKKAFKYCLIFSIFSFEVLLVLMIDMDHSILVFIGIIILSVSLISLVGSLLFPGPILADIIDSAEERTGRSLSGSYQGSMNLFGALSSGTAMMLSTAFLQVYGEESPIPYLIIFSLGGLFVLIALLVFRKVEIIGTKERRARQAIENNN